MDDPGTRLIRWRIRCRSAPDAVFRMLATPEGRVRFWAASAEEEGGRIRFRFSNGQLLESRILERRPPTCLRLTYFGGSTVTFELTPDGSGGTDLTLSEEGAAATEYEQNRAGWIVVLLMLKAALDFRVDLRSHDPARTWEAGYVDV